MTSDAIDDPAGRHSERSSDRTWGMLSAMGRIGSRCLKSRVAVGWAWGVNVALLVGLVVWAVSDGRFPATIEVFQRQLAAGPSDWFGLSGGPDLAQRVLSLKLMAVAAVASGITVVAALVFGSRTHRRLRSWLTFTALVAGWLTFGVAWPEFVWQGQVWRLRGQLAGFENAADALRDDWPTVDGDRPDLGPFLAYPRGAPRVLMLLSPSNTAWNTSPFVAVERTDDDAMRFQLAATEGGAWIEQRPNGGVPRDFVGGVDTGYEVARYSPLAEDWYLVLYNQSRPSELRDRIPR